MMMSLVLVGGFIWLLIKTGKVPEKRKVRDSDDDDDE